MRTVMTTSMKKADVERNLFPGGIILSEGGISQEIDQMRNLSVTGNTHVGIGMQVIRTESAKEE